MPHLGGYAKYSWPGTCRKQIYIPLAATPFRDEERDSIQLRLGELQLQQVVARNQGRLVPALHEDIPTHGLRSPPKSPARRGTSTWAAQVSSLSEYAISSCSVHISRYKRARMRAHAPTVHEPHQMQLFRYTFTVPAGHVIQDTKSQSGRSNCAWERKPPQTRRKWNKIRWADA